MAATMLTANAIGWCILAQLLLLLSQPASGLKCLRTHGNSMPHTRDCGPLALGCRILINPYKVYNDSAVGICRDNLKGGDFIYDCAVDCPPRNLLDWNELICCKGDNCNGNIDQLVKRNYCYVTNKKGANQRGDSLEICGDTQRCALNLVTRETQCVNDSECAQKDKWMCCTSKENCGNTSGIPKVENVQEAESTDANNLTASLVMSVASVVTFYVAVS